MTLTQMEREEDQMAGGYGIEELDWCDYLGADLFQTFAVYVLAATGLFHVYGVLVLTMYIIQDYTMECLPNRASPGFHCPRLAGTCWGRRRTTCS